VINGNIGIGVTTSAVTINNEGMFNGSIYVNANTTFNNLAGATWQAGLYLQDAGTVTATASQIVLEALTGEVDVGWLSGAGMLTLAAGATLTASSMKIGQVGSPGSVDVTGAGTSLTTTSGNYQFIFDGDTGTGSLTVEHQAEVTTTGIIVGLSGDGTLNVETGAVFTSAYLDAGQVAGSTGTVDVNNATLTSQSVTIGDAGTGHATVENGGTITSDHLSIGNHGLGSLTVDGAASIVTTSDLSLGASGGAATLEIVNGAAVDVGTGATTIAGAIHLAETGSIVGAGTIYGDLVNDGSVTVSGGTLNIEGTITGSGSWTVVGGATLQVTSASNDNLTLQQASGATIDLGDGIDTLQLANGSNTVTVKNVETVIGGSGIDNIAIANTAGSTTVIGGLGADIITASAGQDIIRFVSAADSATGNGDHVVNFDAAQDKFDFSAMSGAFASQVEFVDTAAFLGNEHSSAHLEINGGTTLLQIDVNGDGAADMEMQLIGLNGDLHNQNFVLA
jgi:T5SS/PEP-CTERM-associated repeat protein